MPGSDAFVVFAMLTVAESSSPIVLVATRLAGVPSKLALPEVTPVRVTSTVSDPSTVVSSRTGIVIVAVVCEASTVTVPLNAV